jgi:hypothetical protein
MITNNLKIGLKIILKMSCIGKVFYLKSLLVMIFLCKQDYWWEIEMTSESCDTDFDARYSI